jgi:SAM-dependent methyltransferase
MDLNELQKNWDEFGKTDPLWAILTESSRKGGQWNLEEFFASGRQDIVRVMQRAQVLGFPAGRDTALDFGCGVGRLTQALCPWFERCCGVDIAPSMIDLARQYNTHGDRCQYLVNACGDLRVFTDNSFDLVYSKIVLQHMEPRYSTTYSGNLCACCGPADWRCSRYPLAHERTASRLVDRCRMEGFTRASLVIQLLSAPWPDRRFQCR